MKDKLQTISGGIRSQLALKSPAHIAAQSIPYLILFYLVDKESWL